MLSAENPRDPQANSANALVLTTAVVLSASAAASLHHAGVDAAATLSGSLLTGLSVLMLGGWASTRLARVARAGGDQGGPATLASFTRN